MALNSETPVPYEAADCLAQRLVESVPTVCESCTCCSCMEGRSEEVPQPQQPCMDRQKACVHLAGKCLQAQLLSAIAMGKPGADILVQLLQLHNIEHGKRQHPLLDRNLNVRLFLLQQALIVGVTEALQCMHGSPVQALWKSVCQHAGLAHPPQGRMRERAPRDFK